MDIYFYSLFIDKRCYVWETFLRPVLRKRVLICNGGHCNFKCIAYNKTSLFRIACSITSQ